MLSEPSGQLKLIIQDQILRKFRSNELYWIYGPLPEELLQMMKLDEVEQTERELIQFCEIWNFVYLFKMENILSKLTKSTLLKNSVDLMINQTINMQIEILNKNPEDRTLNDIKTLQKLTRHISFFKQTALDVHNSCWRFMGYKFLKEGKHVFHYGDAPDNFYIILSGRVAVMTPTVSNVLATEDRLTGRNISGRLTKAAEMSNGQTFGELALLGNTTRSASIVWLEDTHFIIMNHKNYRHTLEHYHTRNLEINIQLLRKLPAFQHWTHFSLQKLQAMFIEKVYLRNQYLYKIGDESDSVYLIKSGTCTLNQPIANTINNSNNALMRSKSERQIKKTRTNEITILNKGTMFGFEDALKRRPRQYNCICNSETVLLYMHIGEFSRRITNPETWNMLRSLVDIQDDFLESRVQKIQMKPEIMTTNNSPLKQVKSSSKGLNKRNRRTAQSVQKLPIVYHSRYASTKHIPKELMSAPDSPDLSRSPSQLERSKNKSILSRLDQIKKVKRVRNDGSWSRHPKTGRNSPLKFINQDLSQISRMTKRLTSNLNSIDDSVATNLKRKSCVNIHVDRMRRKQVMLPLLEKMIKGQQS